MFGPKDLCTVREVWTGISDLMSDEYGYTASTPVDKIDGKSLFQNTCELCWEFLRGAKTTKIVCSNRKTVPAKVQLFDCYSTLHDVGINISLKIGTVGSGNYIRFYGFYVDLNAIYGAQLHGMVYVNRNEFEAFLFDLGSRTTKTETTTVPLFERIIEFHITNPLARRAEITEALIGRLSGRAFDNQWKIAASKDPTLSGGGRPRMINPDK